MTNKIQMHMKVISKRYLFHDLVFTIIQDSLDGSCSSLVKYVHRIFFGYE